MRLASDDPPEHLKCPRKTQADIINRQKSPPYLNEDENYRVLRTKAWQWSPVLTFNASTLLCIGVGNIKECLPVCVTASRPRWVHP
jgi:hypothetical protein